MRQGDVASVHESLSASLAFDLDTERLGPFERQDEGRRLRERREERPAKRDHLIPDPDQVGIRQEAELVEGGIACTRCGSRTCLKSTRPIGLPRYFGNVFTSSWEMR